MPQRDTNSPQRDSNPLQRDTEPPLRNNTKRPQRRFHYQWLPSVSVVRPVTKNNSSEFHMLGHMKCSWEPEHWCRTSAHTERRRVGIHITGKGFINAHLRQSDLDQLQQRKRQLWRPLTFPRHHRAARGNISWGSPHSYTQRINLFQFEHFMWVTQRRQSPQSPQSTLWTFGVFLVG